MKRFLLGFTLATTLFAGNYPDQRIPSREQQTEWIRQGEQAAAEAEPPKEISRRSKTAKKRQATKRRSLKHRSRQTASTRP